MTPEEKFENPFAEFVDLAAERVGGKVLVANDEFFAPKENLIKAGRGIFVPGKFTEFGKWMDGWETRRRRTPGHDWCVVKLGMPGILRGLDVDTNHFIGNFPEHCSLEAIRSDEDPGENEAWREILPKSALKGGSQNFFKLAGEETWTHLRLKIYPDGGVARFRVYGIVMPDWEKLSAKSYLIDLAAIENGGTVLTCNDNFFGPKDNLILPGRAVNMGDGWETRRKRGPGHDWIIVKLGKPGIVKKVEVDTNHFKGNYPDRCSLEGSFAENGTWVALLPETKLQAHTRHYFEKEILNAPKVSHIRLNIFPDGGVSRLRVYGSVK